MLWWIGWHPGFMLILAVALSATGATYVSSDAWWLGLVFVAGLWIAGVRHVDANWKEHYRSGKRHIEDRSRKLLGVEVYESADVYWLEKGIGYVLAIEPSPEYTFAVLCCTKDFVAIHPDSRLNLRARQPVLGNKTREFYYQHINSVDYDAPSFVLRTGSGESISYEPEPGVSKGAVDTIRTHLRRVAAHWRKASDAAASRE